MTVLIPAADWADLIDSAPHPDEPTIFDVADPDDDLRPAMHQYTPYLVYELDSPCGHLGCGASRMNPLHFV